MLPGADTVAFKNIWSAPSEPPNLFKETSTLGIIATCSVQHSKLPALFLVMTVFMWRSAKPESARCCKNPIISKE